MAEDRSTLKPLVSAKPSDSNFSIALHPIVLLTVSDHITRHRVRGQDGPVVGALLGQQKGREITVEHAFPCKTITNSLGEVLLDQDWFETRLQQYKDVHKLPALEFVGWFTLCPESGPTPAVLPIQKQIIWTYNESALLLAFHPAAISTSTPTTNGKLPFTIYESSFETDRGKEDASMQVDGEEASGIQFRPLTYSIETDETEMIAIDHVAKGGGNAAAGNLDLEAPSSPGASERAEKKGKKRADRPVGDNTMNGTKDSTNPLLPEEEDQIAAMTTRLNSVRMLQSRLSLLSTFIQSQPSSYLSDPNTPLSQTIPDPAHLPHLRNVLALLTRLSLLTPTVDPVSPNAMNDSLDPLSLASEAQSNDVTLSSLLSLLGQDVQGLSEMGRKFASVEAAKSQKGKGKGGFGAGVGAGNFGGIGGEEIGMSGMGMGSMLV